MQLIEDRGLKISIPESLVPKIKDNIEKSVILGTNNNLTEMLIHWGIEEMTKLNQLIRFKSLLPSPIARDYNYPGIYKPFDHQKITSEFLSINHKAFCFNEAGTGKTSSIIWAADYLMNLNRIKKVLVICPNFDGVGVVQEDIKEADYDLIVIDEANAYKSVSTTRWKTINKIIKPHTMLWLLTGTPASQSPEDAYGLARLVCPDNVPKFKTAWRDKVMHQITRFKWVPKKEAKEEVFRVLQPAIRFAKNDCLDLPDVMYQTRYVALTPQVEKYYEALKKQMLIETSGHQVTAVNAAAGLNKLLQISGGAVYTDSKGVIEFDISPRLNALMETIEQTEQKLLIFVPYRHTIVVVTNFLKKNNLSYDVIHGDVSARKRADIINQFQTSDDPRILVIQPQAASHGVTLTRADTVVFWSPVMGVETYLQCIARMDRVGQKNKMTVVHLQGSDVEKRMYKVLQGKVDQHTALVDLYREEIGL